MIGKYFDEFDTDQKGYLTLSEAKQFFATLLDLKYSRSRDRATFRKILKVIDPTNE